MVELIDNQRLILTLFYFIFEKPSKSKSFVDIKNQSIISDIQ